MTRLRKRLSLKISNRFPCLSQSSVTHCDQCQSIVQIFLSHSLLLKKIANTYSLTSDHIDDLLQSFYVKKLVKKTHHFRLDDPTFNTRQYLARMFRNFVHDELRLWQRHRVVEIDHLGGLTHGHQHSASYDIAELYILRNDLSRIKMMVNQSDHDLLQRMLSPKWSVRQEAKEQCVSEVAIRARLRRMRSRLKQVIAR